MRCAEAGDVLHVVEQEKFISAFIDYLEENVAGMFEG